MVTKRQEHKTRKDDSKRQEPAVNVQNSLGCDMLCRCLSIYVVWKDHTAFAVSVERSRLDLLGSERKGTMSLRNVWNCSPNHTVFRRMRLQSFSIIIKT
jgi:hypothetical protein